MKYLAIKSINLLLTIFCLFFAENAMATVNSLHSMVSQKEKEAHTVTLSPREQQEFGIKLEKAGPGTIGITLNLTGEVRLNRDRLANVVSMVQGVVVKTKKYVGDHVRQGEVMAVLNSRELADMKSEYLAARERVAMATATFKREKILWKKKISSQKDYLEAMQALKEANIALVSAKQKLMAIGFSEKDIKLMTTEPGGVLARYEIKAPIEGTVIEKYVALGEAVPINGRMYKIADLRSVWVDLDVYQKDLHKIRLGQRVFIRGTGGGPEAHGKIAYIGPILSESTRTAIARVILKNSSGVFKPGLFVNASVVIDEKPVPLRVLKSALQQLDGAQVLFVQNENGFELREVVLGLSNHKYVEIVSGLSPGETYVAHGAFVLKGELEKERFGGEGHAH